MSNLFGLGAAEPPKPKTTAADNDEDGVYQVPSARAAGRPHDLGWLDMLEDEKDENMRLGKVPAGEIIA